jgi:molybdate transport system substrate-binding protein
MVRRKVLIGLLVLGLRVSAAGAQELRVAAASDLQAILPDIAARFEQASGQKVVLTFGSSGNFFAQIQNGAPFDVFFSADIDYPRRLEGAGLGEAGTLTQYATGSLAMWTPAETAVDMSRGLSALLDVRVRRIAIANPDHAPYGRAAVALLQREGLYERVKDKLVLGENISQAAQFVQSGNADVGLLALSLTRAPAMKSGRVYEVPSSMMPPIEQAAIVIASSKNKAAARDLIAFLQRPEIITLLKSAGFGIP